MELYPILLSAGIGIWTGAVWGAISFIKNKVVNGENFSANKFLKSLVIYAIIGGAINIMGIGQDYDILATVASIFITSEVLKTGAKPVMYAVSSPEPSKKKK